jgi:HPt (histidine-containing phosphotransfer) domain-containing protein
LTREPTGCHLDWLALQGLYALLAGEPPEAMAELVGDFLDSSERLLTQLRQGYAVRDAAEVRWAAHTLKSPSALLGANELASICDTLEQISAGGSLKGTAGLIHHLEDEYQLVRAALLEEVANLSGSH